MNSQLQALSDMVTPRRCRFSKFDKVKLIKSFNNQRVYTVVENKPSGLVSLCPLDGGIIVSVKETNLRFA